MRLAILSLLILGVLLSIWLPRKFVDERLWVDRIALHQANLTGERIDPTSWRHSNSPNFVVLTGAAVLVSLGLSLHTALTLVVAILVTVSATACAALAQRLYPQTLWWAAALITVGFNHKLLATTPPSVVVSALLPWVALSAVALSSGPRRFDVIQFGIASSLAVQSRWPAASIVSFPLWLQTSWQYGLRTMAPGLLAFALVAIVCTPLLITQPVEVAQVSVLRSYLNFDPDIRSTTLDVRRLSALGSVAIISVALACVQVVRTRLWSEKLLPLTLLGGTVLYIWAFTGIAAPALRHWYPLLMTWEVLLPLWVFQLTDNKRLHMLVCVSLALGYGLLMYFRVKTVALF